METDEMELDTIGDRKTALFVIIITLRAKKEGFRLSYNRSGRCWQLHAYDAWINGRPQYGIADEAESLSYLEDSIVEYLPIDDLVTICGGDLVILALYLYDHSGIPMRISIIFYCCTRKCSSIVSGYNENIKEI